MATRKSTTENTASVAAESTEQPQAESTDRPKTITLVNGGTTGVTYDRAGHHIAAGERIYNVTPDDLTWHLIDRGYLIAE